MTRTSVSLLDRLKLAGPDASDWNRLQGIYLPLISRWLGRVPGLGVEADDLAQEVFVVVIRELPRFERQREGSFRAWLRQVTVNKTRTHRRRRKRRPHSRARPGRRVPRQLGGSERRPGAGMGRRPRPPRLPEAAFDRAAGLQLNDVGSIPPVRRRRPARGASGRRIEAERERRPSGQVANLEKTTRGSRRAALGAPSALVRRLSGGRSRRC